MTIGINGYEAVVPRFGYDARSLPRRVGSSNYCFELLVNLNKLDKKNRYIIYLPQPPTADLPHESNNWHYKIVGPRKFWTLFGLSFEFLFKRSDVDVFFSPTHYLPIVVPSQSAIAILDLSYIYFPHLFKKSDLYQLTNWTKYSVRKAKKVFTISEASKNDIMKEYNLDKNQVVVTYLGCKVKNTMQNAKLLKEKYGIKGEYILFVGTLQPRKNVVRLIEAFSLLLESSKKDVQLLLVGKKGWLFDEILNAPKRFDVEENVRFLEFVPDEELSVFYQNALFFILPSLYEGFGLPVVEAMQHGCPVITSNVSSLPEAGGDAALYIDPQNVEDIVSKMNLLLTDEKLRATLVAKGYEQVKKFSWEKTARETLKVLEEVGNKSIE